MKLDGFVDLSQVLAGGIYVLLRQGRPVYVDYAPANLLARLAAHQTTAAKRGLPSWFPIKGVQFDQILINRSHPDRAPAEVAELRARLTPHLLDPPVTLRKRA